MHKQVWTASQFGTKVKQTNLKSKHSLFGSNICAFIKEVTGQTTLRSSTSLVFTLVLPANASIHHIAFEEQTMMQFSNWQHEYEPTGVLIILPIVAGLHPSLPIVGICSSIVQEVHVAALNVHSLAISIGNASIIKVRIGAVGISQVAIA